MEDVAFDYPIDTLFENTIRGLGRVDIEFDFPKNDTVRGIRREESVDQVFSIYDQFDIVKATSGKVQQRGGNSRRIWEQLWKKKPMKVRDDYNPGRVKYIDFGGRTQRTVVDDADPQECDSRQAGHDTRGDTCGTAANHGDVYGVL
jgi:hypothetical protein